ncbi:GNAT family N-acetyltransferase [Rathayibacter sp. YIM 133350]|uniref:GNAT family N-acetyltransferase n=1 Tax=Rathayibacter sp. YIM 133350 TaxID=3131992 RepID=UPI00307F55AE
MPFSVRATTEDDWANYRDIRIEMLTDSPDAFFTTLADVVDRGEAFWRERVSGASSFTVAAVDTDDDRWLGVMTGVIASVMTDAPESAVPQLVGVYVRPEARGAGVADALLEAIESWARVRGDALHLEVHDGNSRAVAFYARRGFELTGRSTPHPRRPGAEVEMRRVLR